MLKVLDLFSGIGGFSLGLESTGHFETIAFCEKDKFCQKVLQKNFKNIPIEGEIRNVKGEKYKADVVTGGFPCQPFSIAGKRKGTDDDRYLWDETIRVVRECKPKWFIGENVEGIINIQEGMVLRQVQTDLEKEGFEVQCLIIPASGIGAWHQRKRVWIIGCNVSNSDKSRSFKEYSTSFNRQNKGDGFINESGSRSNENVSNTDSRMRRRGRTIGESGTNQVWGFHIKKEKQSEQNFRSKVIGCDDLFREDVSDSNGKRSQGYKFQQHLETRKQSSTNDGKESFKSNKPGGKLNPNFVEFLMGYPMNWTKIEPTESKHLETQSYPKLQENLEKQSLKQKMYRTPTSMDINEDSMIYAAKILKGKVNRNSNQRVQITLSTDVAMEYLKNNPELIDQFDKPFMYRPNLPDKFEFIEYLKSQITIKELVNNTDIPKTKIEHWFRKDNCFSYPTIDDWNKIKPLLKQIKFDEELTHEVEKDWKEIE